MHVNQPGENPVPVEQPVPSVVKRHEPDGVTTLVELSNGLTVIVQENRTTPIVSVRCFVKNTGSAFEGRLLGSGISHLLEHLVAGGTTTKRTEKEIEHLVERMGGVTNAFTSDDQTCYFIDSASDQVATTIELVADMMQRVVFEQVEFEREHKVVKQELRDGLNDRRRVLWNLLGQTVYRDSTARHPVIGYYDVLSRLSRTDVVDFYRQRYVPNNMVFVVVGDVDREETLKTVAENFAGGARGTETVVPLPDEEPQVSPREAVREMDGQTSDLLFAWPGVKLSDPEMYALDVASYILSEGESSRLVRKLVYEKQLLLGVSTFNNTPHFVNGQFCAMGVATPDKREEAADELLSEIMRLTTEKVGRAELDKAKKQKEAELVFTRQKVSGIADSLGRCMLATGDPLYDNRYVEGIRGVTADDVLNVAKKYFVPERLNRIVIVPKDMGARPVGGETAAHREPETLTTLPNGLRVLFKRRADLPMVNVQAFVFGSTLDETEENAGQSALLAAMLDKGTKTKTAEQIADYFDSIGGSLALSNGRNTLYGGVTVLAADFEPATRLFAECLLQSTFPQTEFEQVKTLALGAVARRADNPMSELMELFAANLPKGSPYSRMEDGSAESVAKIDLAALKKQHAKQFVPSNMLVTVFGDVDPETAMKTVAETFGQLPQARGAAANPVDIAKIADNTITVSEKVHKTTAKDSGVLLIAWNAPAIDKEKDMAAMRVLSAVLSDGTGPNGWLFNELRGEGLVYRVNTALRTGPVAGFFIAVAQTKPEQVAEVEKRIRANIEKVKSGAVPRDDFERAKERLVSRHKQSNETIAEQAMQAGLDELYGLGYAYDKSFPDRIRAVTLEEVVAVANTYLTESLVVSASSQPGEPGR